MRRWYGSLFVFLFVVPLHPVLYAAEKVTVYAYDSFCGKGTLGEIIQKNLKARGIETEFVIFADAGEVLNQVEIEKEKTRADIVIGIDASLLSRAERTGLFQPIDPGLWKGVPKNLWWDPKKLFIPFDYSWIAFVYDSRRVDSTRVKSWTLAEFASAKGWDKKMVVEDPRTSSVGRMFLLATAQELGEKGFIDFWKQARPKWITIPPSWSSAYGMFLNKEVDFVLSYTTSPAYHCENDKTEAFRSVLFKDGNMMQVEGAGIVRTSKHKAAASEWIRALLSPPIQREVPKTQWMYPVNPTAELPTCFSNLPKVERSISADLSIADSLPKKWIPRWNKLQALDR